MKPNWVKLILILLIAAVFSACISTPENLDEYQSTFPSQFIIGDTYILKSHEKINGNIVGIGTSLILEQDALVMGDISLVGSNLEVSGRIAGDLNVLAGSTIIKDTAIITGNINQFFQTTEIDPKALVAGEINTYIFPLAAGGQAGTGIRSLMDWLRPGKILAIQGGRVISLVLLALIGIYLLKTPTTRIVSALSQNPPAAWGAGLLTIITVPIVAVVLIVSICLSPVGILLVIAFFLCCLWGWVALSSILGTNLIKWLKLDWAFEPATILGALILGILSVLFSLIPCIGFLLNLMVTAAGLGGVLLSKFGLAPD